MIKTAQTDHRGKLIRFDMRAPRSDTAVTVGATSTDVLAENSLRTHAIIKSADTNTEIITLGFGVNSAVAESGIVLDPGETLQIGPLNHYEGAIRAICASGGMKLFVFEA